MASFSWLSLKSAWAELGTAQLNLFMFQSILNIWKINNFYGWGVPPPFAENSVKIINLIFEPFPKSFEKNELKRLLGPKNLNQQFVD